MYVYVRGVGGEWVCVCVGWGFFHYTHLQRHATNACIPVCFFFYLLHTFARAYSHTHHNPAWIHTHTHTHTHFFICTHTQKHADVHMPSRLTLNNIKRSH